MGFSTHKLVLIRHAMTAGNLAGQYIGRTDQPLCEAGIAQARAAAAAVPTVGRVYCSPMLRCRQTAEILYSNHAPRAVAALREADLGLFEGKTHAELEKNPAYRQWIAAAGALPPPGGEDGTHFRSRCVAAFRGILNELANEKVSSAACVLHGGSIMAIMAARALPARPFYDWQVHNCCGFIVNADADSGRLTLLAHLETGLNT